MFSLEKQDQRNTDFIEIKIILSKYTAPNCHENEIRSEAN
jgi:hypothetical protein